MSNADDGDRRLFWIAICFGVVLAVGIYGVFFDRLSETELVNFSALWVLPTVFGLYGLLATRLARDVESGKAPSASHALLGITAHFRPAGLLVLLLASPVLIGGTRPMLAATIGAAIWVLLLMVFFNVIFPLL